ncbi:hypothetical protein LR48_Vigan05g196200 [Vigna angularis]|uniref:Inhibitor I9 domain-containing protein n=1 Tax=Phaseolus angularis TaxID=3914 RepID=A0A0L9UP34_PHAAN|nr:hypothetical protein LR48_Vigan05g196200 [Vigna angularis]
MENPPLPLLLPRVDVLALIFALISVCLTTLAHQNSEFAKAIEEHYLPTKEINVQNSLLTYIVRVERSDEGGDSLRSKDLLGWYRSLLPSSLESDQNLRCIIFLYRNVMDGFAVELTPEEAEALQEKEEVVSVRLESTYSLHTTHTPTFLGLQ